MAPVVEIVTVPKQRNPNPGNWRRLHSEPPWCTGVHNEKRVHRSEPIKVGDRQSGGQVTVWLEEKPGQPTTVGVNVAHLGGMTIDIPAVAAAELVDRLTELLDRARNR